MLEIESFVEILKTFRDSSEKLDYLLIEKNKHFTARCNNIIRSFY